MTTNDVLIISLVISLGYTQYNLWVVRKQLELLKKSLDELRD
jgi:hypothetical protein